VKRVRVVAALIPLPSDGSRFLVQQRLPGKAHANLWEFPGGKVEPGESDEAALVRECQEELGVTVKAGRRVWGTEHAYPELFVQLELWSATLVEGEPQPLGAQALAFCTPKQMQALPFCEADVALLNLLASGELAP
jgi:8-oxo-dGTP diphosphatase